MKEVLEPGDRVRVKVTPGCGSEGLCHGIAPLANNLVGVVTQFHKDFCHEGDGHDYIVVLLSNSHNGYFRRDELEEMVG